jgi:hypothetical protein
MTRRSMRLAALAFGAALAAGCGNDTSTPTSATPSNDPITTPVTVTFTGVVGPGGTASRSFAPRIAGTATATVSAISPSTPLGVGLGLPRADGTGCMLARSTIATDGGSAQVATPVDVGTFCVQVYAPAQSAAQVTFSVTLVYP